jgi:hypothetical protein
MPRYFFDIDNGPNSHSDDTGIEIDAGEVVKEAGQFLADLAKDEMRKEGETTIRVHVRNEAGHSVCEGELTLRSRWHRDD